MSFSSQPLSFTNCVKEGSAKFLIESRDHISHQKSKFLISQEQKDKKIIIIVSKQDKLRSVNLFICPEGKTTSRLRRLCLSFFSFLRGTEKWKILSPCITKTEVENCHGISLRVHNFSHSASNKIVTLFFIVGR